MRNPRESSHLPPPSSSTFLHLSLSLSFYQLDFILIIHLVYHFETAKSRKKILRPQTT